MTTKLDEFSISLPMTMASDSTVSDAATVVSGPVQDIPSLAIGSPAPMPAESKRISVYPNGITAISFSGDDNGVAAFDIVFSVGISCEDGSTKTYQVVKRIGIDKQKIASEVEGTQPTTVVESQEVQTARANKTATIKRARRLAGLE